MPCDACETRPTRPRLWTLAEACAKAMALALTALALSGCGRAAGVIFEPLDPPLRWPAPPDRPRLEYVGSLAAESDLKPAQSFFDGLGRALFGAEAPRAMLSPMDVATIDSRVFVADSNAQVVHVFDLDTRRYQRWAPDEAHGGFSQPVALAADDRGRLLVADAVAGVIDVFDARGQLVAAWGAGELARPAGVAFDPAHQRILVTDSAQHHIAVFDLDGNLLRTVGGRGSDLGSFNYPTAIDVAPDGSVVVSDSLNFRVALLDQNLAPIRAIGAKGDMPGYFGLPKGVAFDSHGRIIVVDAHFEAVQLFDALGRLLTFFGVEGQAPGEFWLPVGAHVDQRDGWLWIADSYNKRVQVFRFLEEAQP